MTALIEITMRVKLTRDLGDMYSDVKIEQAARAVEKALKGVTLIPTVKGSETRVGIYDVDVIDWDGQHVPGPDDD